MDQDIVAITGRPDIASDPYIALTEAEISASGEYAEDISTFTSQLYYWGWEEGLLYPPLIRGKEQGVWDIGGWQSSRARRIIKAHLSYYDFDSNDPEDTHFHELVLLSPSKPTPLICDTSASYALIEAEKITLALQPGMWDKERSLRLVWTILGRESNWQREACRELVIVGTAAKILRFAGHIAEGDRLHMEFLTGLRQFKATRQDQMLQYPGAVVY